MVNKAIVSLFAFFASACVWGGSPVIFSGEWAKTISASGLQTNSCRMDHLAGTPSNPPAGSTKVYFKADGKFYKLSSAGVEEEIGAGGGLSPEFDIGSSGASFAVDWSNSQAQTVELDQSTTLSAFSNPSSGSMFTLRVKQDATGSRTISWPPGIWWDGGVEPSLNTLPGAIDLFRFYSDGTNYYAQHTSHPNDNSWPFGALGDYTVADYTIDYWPAGTVLDYNNLTISSFGQIQMNSGEEGWLRIGVRGNLIVNGNIYMTAGNSTGGTFNSNEIATNGTPTGPALSYTITYGAGGSGGGGRFSSGGANGSGNGGGGGSGGIDPGPGVNGGAASASTTGYGGGNPTNNPGITNNMGIPGNNGASACGDYSCDAKGGSGGFRGWHGTGIWIYVKGNWSGTGSINASGTGGGSGGSGGNGDRIGFGDEECEGGGGGGGGGAGGPGGKIIVKYGTKSFTGGLNVGGAGGGGAGPAGTNSNPACPGFNGSSGGAGANGPNGTIVETAI